MQVTKEETCYIKHVTSNSNMLLKEVTSTTLAIISAAAAAAAARPIRSRCGVPADKQTERLTSERYSSTIPVNV